MIDRENWCEFISIAAEETVVLQLARLDWAAVLLGVLRFNAWLD